MRKTVKIILLVIAIISVAILYFIFLKGAGTFYTGYVGIESISLKDIVRELEMRGCNSPGSNGILPYCEYNFITVNNENGVEIFPHGGGMAPLSFKVTENKLYASKGIHGFPWYNKYKEEVRQDIREIGNFIKIKEDFWKITDIIYPMNWVY